MEKEWVFVCKPESNYDGDTFKLEIDLGFALKHYVTIRLHSVDTPELRGGTDLTKALGKLARDKAEEFITKSNIVSFISKQWGGKYGRPTGDLVCDRKSLTDYLISHRMGVPYDGSDRTKILDLHKENAEWHEAEGNLDEYLK